MSDDIGREDIARATLDEEIINAWRGMVVQPAGRLILWSILEKCGVFNFDHYGNDQDVIHKGRQQVGSELLRDFVFPHGMQLYADMLIEAEDRDRRIEMAIATDEKTDEEGDE
tara:strand:- start:11741 stop:12079 length:339 start_codon:yes stop_codon:yes gene_type:complete